MFIAVEGINGSGKTSFITALSKKIAQKNIKMLLTEEPYRADETTMKDIKELLKKDSLVGMESKKLEMLFAINRINHLTNVILPALNNNHLVISDRYVMSSFAYQGEATLTESVESNNKYSTSPDLTFYIQTSPEVALTRILQRTDWLQKKYGSNENFKVKSDNTSVSVNAFCGEDAVFENLAVLTQVADRYSNLFQRPDLKKLAGELFILDGNLAPEQLAEQAMEQLDRFSTI